MAGLLSGLLGKIAITSMRPCPSDDHGDSNAAEWTEWCFGAAFEMLPKSDSQNFLDQTRWPESNEWQCWIGKTIHHSAPK
jgi:hypothetical protein